MNRLSRPTIVVMSLALALLISCGGGTDEEPIVESTVGSASSGTPASTHVDTTPNRLIRLVEPLDDPDHYCIDVRGFGSNVRVNDSLQAHTCKPADNRDMQFTYLPSSSQIYTEKYDLCVEPESHADGSQMFLRECSGTSAQQFSPLADGTIRLSSAGESELCIAVEAGEGHVINPIHKRRELFVRSCDTTDSNLMTWLFASGAAGTGS